MTAEDHYISNSRYYLFLIILVVPLTFLLFGSLFLIGFNGLIDSETAAFIALTFLDIYLIHLLIKYRSNGRIRFSTSFNYSIGMLILASYSSSAIFLDFYRYLRYYQSTNISLFELLENPISIILTLSSAIFGVLRLWKLRKNSNPEYDDNLTVSIVINVIIVGIIYYYFLFG